MNNKNAKECYGVWATHILHGLDIQSNFQQIRVHIRKNTMAVAIIRKCLFQETKLQNLIGRGVDEKANTVHAPQAAHYYLDQNFKETRNQHQHHAVLLATERQGGQDSDVS